MQDEYVPNGVVGAVVHSSRKEFTKVKISPDSPIKYAVCAAIVPGARLSLYQGAGHASFYDAADRFNDELASFARAASASS